MANIVPDSFKTDLLKGTFSFDTSGNGGSTFKIALYTSLAAFSTSTTQYITTNQVANGNGYTNKELLNIIIETQEKTNERIDLLHEKVNSKISRQELFGWIVAVGALAALVGNLM